MEDIGELSNRLARLEARLEGSPCIADPSDLPIQMARMEASIGELGRGLMRLQESIAEIAAARSHNAAEVSHLSQAVDRLQTTMRVTMAIITGVGVPLVLAVLPVLLEHHLQRKPGRAMAMAMAQVEAPTMPVDGLMPDGSG